ncbi:type II toxin-antitoxin system HipA family toxin [Rhodobacteraceae bacterium]|nr:type II toxin-antitoxin system HipA family toxin [Paracoccaceae bacterium]
MLTLDVYLEGTQGPIGTLQRDDTGAVSFAYRRVDLPHPVSQSLPLGGGAFDDVQTRGYFANLLFENALRDQVMQRHGLDHTDIVGLLYHLGQDCPGAISVVPQGMKPGKQPGDLGTDYTPLDPIDLNAIMRALRDHRRMPDGSDDPSPLAGVQGKVAVTQLASGQLALPRAGSGAPTTHILKVPRANEMALVDHEHILMGIAADILDHGVARTKIIGTGDLRGLLIERYDRVAKDGRIYRVHQEDFCQALGIGPALKYERNAVGAQRFSASRIGALLAMCDVPANARSAFFEGAITSLLLGNTDNHAKNYSLLYNAARSERPVLAPFYDIVPTLIDSSVTHQMAFDIGHAKMTDDITLEDLTLFAKALGYRNLTAAMKGRLGDIVMQIVALIPQMTGPIRKRLGDVFSEQATSLANALGLDSDIPERDLIVINRP